MRRSLAPALTLALAAGLAVSAPVAPAHALGNGTLHPQRIIARDHADPEIIQVGGTYYSYATNQGMRVPVRTSKEIARNWSQDATDAMPTNAAWSTGKHYWAPEVLPLSATDFRLYFTAEHKTTGTECIGVARATSPLGPFTPQPTPLQCIKAEGGAIDAATFRDTDGKLYLLYKNDGNRVGVTSKIWLQQLTADGMGYVGSRTALISADRAEEAKVVEAPVLLKRGGRYVLFYSAGVYSGAGYHESYATATSLRGPYTKAFRPLVTTASVDGSLRGPGGADVVASSQGDKIIMHGWVDKQRHAYVADIGFPGGYPVVRGSRVRYEAELGKVNHAKVVARSGYSQGKMVGYIDYADSYVELTVWVPTAGDYTAHVFYDAGLGDATHHVSANGVAQGDVHYAKSPWGTVKQAPVNVRLKAGSNTIRLAKGNGYAQVDHVEVA